MSVIERKIDVLGQRVETFDERFERIDEAIRKLTDVMLQQVRTEGNVERLNDALHRIGRQVDKLVDEQEAMQKRIGAIEVSTAVGSSRLAGFNQHLWWIMGIIGAAAGYFFK